MLHKMHFTLYHFYRIIRSLQNNNLQTPWTSSPPATRAAARPKLRCLRCCVLLAELLYQIRTTNSLCVTALLPDVTATMRPSEIAALVLSAA